MWLSSCCRCRRAAWYRDVLCRTVDQSSCRGMFSMAFSSDRSMVNHQMFMKRHIAPWQVFRYSSHCRSCASMGTAYRADDVP